MKRHWVKLWVNEWLEGTTRFQMTGAQRAFWTDLLAMAGRSRFPGIVCSGRDGDSYVGYPITTFAALDPGAELDIQATFELFVATGKIVLEVTAEKPVKLFKVTITNWSKYQSEYQRQKPYQETYRKKSRELSAELTPSLSPNYLLEGEVRSEKEKEKEKEKTKPAPETGAVVSELPDWLPKKELNDYLRMRKRIRKEATPEAITLAIRELEKLRAAGNDPKLVLEQSILNSWQGLFELRVNIAAAREVERNRDASVGRHDPNRVATPAMTDAEFKEAEIESQRWKKLEAGSLEVTPETTAWVQQKIHRLRGAKLPAQDPRPKWFKAFLDRARAATPAQVSA